MMTQVRPGDIVLYASGIIRDHWRVNMHGPCIVISVASVPECRSYSGGQCSSVNIWCLALDRHGTVVQLCLDSLRGRRQIKCR